MVKNPLANVGDSGDAGSTPGLGRSPGEGNSKPLQGSYLENPMDRGCIHRVAKSWTAGAAEHTCTCPHIYNCISDQLFSKFFHVMRAFVCNFVALGK